MTKMTYAQALEVAINAVDGEVAEKLIALKAQIEKKNSAERKPTKTQRENAEYREKILDLIAETPMTATEVAELIGLTNQRVTALLTALVRAELVERTVEKGKARFKAVAIA